MKRIRIGRPYLLLLVVGATSACGEPIAPDPEPEVEIAGPPTEPPVAGSPFLPVPASLHAEVPRTSDTLTVIAPLTTHFRPEVNRMRGMWDLWYRECFDVGLARGCHDWRGGAFGGIFGTRTAHWSDALPTFSAEDIDVPMSLAAPVGRHLMVRDGVALDSVFAHFEDRTDISGPYLYDREHDFSGEGLASPVHIRRDRFWEWVTIPLAGDFILLIGDTEATIITTVTVGTSETETESFGRSVTVSAGGSAGPFSASVSATLSEAYSTSVTIEESTTQGFNQTVRGSAGKTTRYMVWSLIEEYTFTDADGEPLTDPNYDIVPDRLVRRGVSTALQATEFLPG